jgi:hypothetical protein
MGMSKTAPCDAREMDVGDGVRAGNKIRVLGGLACAWKGPGEASPVLWKQGRFVLFKREREREKRREEKRREDVYKRNKDILTHLS